ncbi:MAG: response regulator [Pyrinomonadaceae bacterium]|nr:response regulator [Pyrinomonadaceae bacterium]
MNRIVIIEDHPVLLSIYRNKFVEEGFQVEIASDGESGIELIERIKPDLVVMDLAMPKINGIEVLRWLRANPLFRALPVIIFSDSAWKQQASKEGATVVLSKSKNTPSQVVETARNALRTFGSQQLEDTLATNVAFLAGSSAAPAESTQSRKTKGQVLLVEDRSEIRATISAALSQSGFRVTEAENHAAALQQVEAGEFDAYLLNRVCPDGLGLALCRRLRQLFPHKPIVLYSTVALSFTAEQRLKAGASAYLTQAEDVLHAGRILSKLVDEAKTTPVQVDTKVTDELVSA